MSIPLILVVPGLLAQPPQALAGMPSLATLARQAAPPRLARRGIAAALVSALGARDDTPIAPLAALGAGVAPGADYVSMADPVFLAADRDDVVLVRRVDDLAPEAAAALAALLDRHFADDGLHFLAVRPDAWFVRCASAPEIVTTPLDAALARGIYAHLPRGRDAGTWKRWQNEIEMLLHEHPLNAAREAAGDAPVTGIWFWGGGRLTDVGPLPVAAVTAATGRIGDVARGIARAGGGTATNLEPSDAAARTVAQAAAADGPSPAVAIVVGEAIDREAALADIEERWLAPALALLDRRRIDALDLIADGNGTAAHWRAKRPGWWRRIVAGVQARPFAVPGRES
jgi:hypothetical protein